MSRSACSTVSGVSAQSCRHRSPWHSAGSRLSLGKVRIGVSRRGLAVGEAVAVVEERGADADGDGEVVGGDVRAEDAVVGGRGADAQVGGGAAGGEEAGPRRQRPQQVGQLCAVVGDDVEGDEGGRGRCRGEDAGLVGAVEGHFRRRRGCPRPAPRPCRRSRSGRSRRRPVPLPRPRHRGPSSRRSGGRRPRDSLMLRWTAWGGSLRGVRGRGSSRGLPDLQQVRHRREVLQQLPCGPVQPRPRGRVERSTGVQLPPWCAESSSLCSRARSASTVGSRCGAREVSNGRRTVSSSRVPVRLASAVARFGAAALVGVAGELELEGVLQDLVGAQGQVAGVEVLGGEGFAQSGGVGGELLCGRGSARSRSGRATGRTRCGGSR